jgi:gas vesicle protein
MKGLQVLARVGISIAALLVGGVLAQSDTLTASTKKVAEFTVRVATDPDDIEDLKEQIDELREDVQESIADIREDLEESRSELKEDCAEAREDIAERSEDGPRHKGASGIITAQFIRIDTDPLAALVKAEKKLQGKSFDFEEVQTAPMIGIMGYYDQGNGVRVGHGLWAGYKRFQSEYYSGLKVDSITGLTQTVDSVVLLRVIPIHAGFILEKSFGVGTWNIFAGGMIGGGAEVVVSQFKEADGNIFLTDDGVEESDHHNDGSIGATVATYCAWDVHAGASVRLAPAFSLGVDGVVLFNYSPEGFGRVSGNYLTVNPGLRLRLTFGKIG